MTGPALGVLEFESIAVGILAGDAMVKAAPVSSITAGTIHPGRYLVLVTGDVASVEEAMTAGRARGAVSIVDEVLLPDVHPAVVAAIGSVRGEPSGEALGIVETATVSSAVAVADAGVKAAEVVLMELHLADDLGGKAYALFSGTVGDVEMAVEAGGAAVGPVRVLQQVVLPMLASEMGDNLWSAARFVDRIGESDATG
jgi:microcompartment protein CcmL/EutN